MRLELAPETEAELRKAAREEGLSVENLVEALLFERQEVGAIVGRAGASGFGSRGEIRAKIERGFAQSERGELVDGEQFGRSLIAEIDELDRNRPAR